MSKDQRKQIHRWYNTPKDKRQPRTVQELAEQLGVHRNTVNFVRGQTIDNLPNRYWGSGLELDPHLKQAIAALVPKSNRTPAVHAGTQAAPKPAEMPAPRSKVVPPVTRVHRSEHEINSNMVMNEEQRKQAYAEFARYPEWARQYAAETVDHPQNCDCVLCHIQRIVASQKNPFYEL